MKDGNEPNYRSEMLGPDGSVWRVHSFWAATQKEALAKFETLWMSIHRERVGGSDIAQMRLSCIRTGKGLADYSVRFDDLEKVRKR